MKNNKPRGIFTQSWAERYNMDNPMNLKEFPHVEFWVDTKWEPYKEGIQKYIRRHLTTDGKDLAELIEFTIDLGKGDEEWIYTAHSSDRHKCPPTSWIPGCRIFGETKDESTFPNKENIVRD